MFFKGTSYHSPSQNLSFFMGNRPDQFSSKSDIRNPVSWRFCVFFFNKSLFSLTNLSFLCSPRLQGPPGTSRNLREPPGTHRKKVGKSWEKSLFMTLDVFYRVHQNFAVFLNFWRFVKSRRRNGYYHVLERVFLHLLVGRMIFLVGYNLSLCWSKGAQKKSIYSE